jgi:hypothetical protein
VKLATSALLRVNDPQNRRSMQRQVSIEPAEHEYFPHDPEKRPFGVTVPQK